MDETETEARVLFARKLNVPIQQHPKLWLSSHARLRMNQRDIPEETLILSIAENEDVYLEAVERARESRQNETALCTPLQLVIGYDRTIPHLATAMWGLSTVSPTLSHYPTRIAVAPVLCIAPEAFTLAISDGISPRRILETLRANERKFIATVHLLQAQPMIRVRIGDLRLYFGLYCGFPNLHAAHEVR